MSKVCTEIVFYCWNIIQAVHCRLIALNYKSSKREILGCHSVLVPLDGRFEDLKLANQRNIPEDKYPESKHFIFA